MRTFFIIPCISVLVLMASACSRQARVATIKADGGYEVRIVADRFFEYQKPFYCELWRNGRKLKSAQFIEATDKTQFKLVEANDKSGFKIIDPSTHSTIAIYNRKTGESWPWSADSETPQATQERRDRLNSLFTNE